MKTQMAAKAKPAGGTTRAGDKKLAAPVTLFAQIEAEQHEGLRGIAFAERRSLADVVREAFTEYLARQRGPGAARPAAALAARR